MQDLSKALSLLAEAAAAAAAELHNDDTATVRTQATAALESCTELTSAVESEHRERALNILHKLNNKLTGSLSLTMLAREDLPSGSEHHGALENVERLARTAATAARDVANAIKATSA